MIGYIPVKRELADHSSVLDYLTPTQGDKFLRDVIVPM